MPAITVVFYDGATNRRRIVSLRTGDALEVIEHGTVLASWPFSDIRRIDGGDALRLRSVSMPDARLDIRDPALAAEIAVRCPLLDAEISNVKTLRIVGWSLAAVTSILLIVFYGLPIITDRIAPLIPLSAEARLGTAVDNQIKEIFDGNICEAEDGLKALTTLVGRLDPEPGDLPIKVEVLSAKIPNAVTLPGGKIYIFDALLQQARTPDELSGVLAHEIGHVRNRDVLRSVIKAGGTSFMMGLLFGDVTGSGMVIFVANSLFDASHSREAELAADDYAIDTMSRLGRSAMPMGELLLRITGDGKTGTLLDSHPVSAHRLERIKQKESPVTGPAILSDSEWSALKKICGAE